MFRKIITVMTAILLMSCGDDATDVNRVSDEELPQIPPLTYTWSHPDCPFTVDFPGKPLENIGKTDKGVVSIQTAYRTDGPSYGFDCDAYVLNVFPDVESYTDIQLAELYAEQITLLPEFENAVMMSIDKTPFDNLSGAILFYSLNTANAEELMQLNAIVLKHNHTMADVAFSYPSSTNYLRAGKKFLNSVKIKKTKAADYLIKLPL